MHILYRQTKLQRGYSMNEKFYLGMLLGALGGAMVVANSLKARKAIVNGQEQVMEKIEEFKDGKSNKKTQSTKKNG